MKLCDLIKGRVLARGDAEFETAATGALWNHLLPERRPELVVQVADVEDVQTAVRYASENGMKVAIQGGGHNWVATSLRTGGMLIDLQRLTRVVSIDAEARRAVVEPIISNREMIRHLEPYGLAYPTGHCPTVKLSGYLLSGGMSWNHGVWGSGCGSVEAIEMVTAGGELVTASAEQNSDLFWAARGAGPGQFAIAVRYHLRLYPLPRHIAASSYLYRYEDTAAIAEWVYQVADRLDPMVELSLFIIRAPEHLEAGGPLIAMVTATIFADSAEEAEQAGQPLEECPLRERCLDRTFVKPTTFEEIFDLSGALWPEGVRNRVDAMFSHAPLKDVMGAVSDHLPSMPPETVFMFAVYTGGSPPAPPADAAFGMTAKLYGGPWTMWREAGDDAACRAWHEECLCRLAPSISGHYVSETDTVGHPEFLGRAYTGGTLERIEGVRRLYDPTGLFFRPTEGLS